MKRIIRLLLLITATLLLGCIENDIPFPVVKGDVVEIAFSGQLEPPKIWSSSQKIVVDLSDTVDIQNVKLTNLKVVDEGVADIDPNGIYDLSSPYFFTVRTYQDYAWTIEANQQVDRYFNVVGQVGESVVDVNNRLVVVYIPADVDKKNVEVLSAKLGSSNSTIYPEVLGAQNFEQPLKVVVTDYGATADWTIVVQQVHSNVSTELAEPWATFAILRGSFSTGSGMVPTFLYRKKSDASWIEVDGSSIVISNGKFSARVVGLTPNSEYVFCAKLGEEKGAEASFQTEDAPAIPNLNFDTWHQTGKNWYPNPSDGNSFWGTGNEGVTMSPVNKPCNSRPVAESVSGSAARLETIAVPIVKLAAGNLFTGKYKTNLGDPIKSVTFGRPYTGRPTRLEGYYKNAPKPIDVAKAGYENLKGTTDKCHIYIRLENWGTAAERPEEPEVIAYGELLSDKVVEDFTQFAIDIEYNSTAKRPTHIVLVATSSYMGDFFTGGVGSVLVVDDFALKFD